jgi:glucosylceramidase
LGKYTPSRTTRGTQTISLTGLNGNTAKDVYIRGKDAAGNASNTVKVTVPAYVPAPVAVTGVTLNAKTQSVAEGKSFTLAATVAPTNATNKTVTWASSNTAVAKVDANGKVTAVKAGTATITVTTKDGAKKASCTVTVTAQLIANGTYVIRTINSYSTTKVLDVPGQSTANGTNVVTWTDGNTANQKWKFTRVG